MAINFKTVALRAVLFLLLVGLLDRTVGWNIRHIKDRLSQAVQNGFLETWSHSETPNFGIALIPERVFPDRAKIAIQGLQELKLPNYSIDNSFLVHPKLPDNLFNQRLIEGAWPIEFHRDSNFRVFANLDQSAEKTCRVLWQQGEVSIGDCSK
jgi:hypothetical protein